MEQVRSLLAHPPAPSAHRRAARARLVAGALALAAAAVASSAAAQTPPERAAPPSPAPPSSSAPPAAPPVAGLPPGATWEETVAAYQATITALQRQARSADARGAEEERRRVELEIEATERGFRDFEERTTERNSDVMMISGLALAGLGGVALLGGMVLVVAHRDDVGAQRRESQTLVLATAIGGVAGVAVGVPLYVIGKKRVRKDLEPSAPVAARLLVGPGAIAASPGAGPLAVGLRVAF
ncbi:hypothetical protein WME99_31095 [Sorangium sp. So ce136]|uniref:hypothetical protein n=1 Tax=Sorangium sp. So ce136 TaxID=3133284 RepID=UPI003F0C06A8